MHPGHLSFLSTVLTSVLVSYSTILQQSEFLRFLYSYWGPHQHFGSCFFELLSSNILVLILVFIPILASYALKISLEPAVIISITLPCTQFQGSPYQFGTFFLTANAFRYKTPAVFQPQWASSPIILKPHHWLNFLLIEKSYIVQHRSHSLTHIFNSFSSFALSCNFNVIKFYSRLALSLSPLAEGLRMLFP